MWLKFILFLIIFSVSLIEAKEKDWSVWIKKIELKNDWKKALKASKKVIAIFTDDAATFKTECNRWIGNGCRKSHRVSYSLHK